MSKLSAILTAVATASLLTVGACATKEDIEALRSDIAAQRAAIEAPGAARTSGAAASSADIKALRSDIAAQRATIEAVGAARTSGATASSADIKALRSDIAALRTAVEAAGATHTNGAAAASTVAAMGPPPAEYQKLSTLVKLPEFIPGLGALYVRPQTLPAGPFLAYDRDNRLASTIYMIPLSDVTARKTFEHLAVGDGTVQDVDFYYNPGHPGVEEPHYHVVLWHVPEDSAKLQ